MRCRFEVVLNTPELLVLKDVGHDVMSITNDVESLVEYLMEMSSLWPGRRLEYIDSNGQQDEILIEAGKFAGFKLHHEGNSKV